MTRKTQKSHELQKRAEEIIPGGVNSPVRAFRSVGGEPPFIAVARVRAYGTWTGTNTSITWLSWGPQILGHAVPK